MPYAGTMAVDWEERINFQRLREERLARAKQAINAFNVDALLLFRWENTRYTVGQRYVPVPSSPFEHLATFVFLIKDRDPILFTMDEEDTARRAPWIKPENICRGYYVQTLGGARALMKHLEKIYPSITHATVGIDLLPPAIWKTFLEAFPDAKLASGEEVLASVRMVKTPDELECLKVAYAITEAGMQAGIDLIRPGVRECEVQGAIWKRVYELGAEYHQSPGIVTTQTIPYRRFTSDNIILEGDAVIIDVGAEWNGYFSDFTRMWYCGEHSKPTPAMKDAYKGAIEIMENVIKAMKPGATMGEIYKAAGPNVLGEMLGHGIGLAGQEFPFITAEESISGGGIFNTLQPGMVFAVEPYVQGPPESRIGIRLEQNVIITETGNEVYSTFPYGPLAE